MSKSLLWWLIGAVISPTAPAIADVVERDFHKSFEVSRGMRLDLHHGDGDVEILRWEKDVIDVEVAYRADHTTVGISRVPELHVDFSATDRRIEVRERFEGSRVSLGIHVQRELVYTYTIHAPDYIVLHLDGDDGDVRVTDWTADVDCKNDDGDLSLERIRGRVDVHMQDGSLDLMEVEGDVEIDVDDGDVLLDGVTADSIRIRFEDGRVEVRESTGEVSVTGDDGDLRVDTVTTSRFQARSGDGSINVHLIPHHDEVDYDLETDDGDLDLALSGSPSARLAIRTDDGRIDVDLEGAEVLEDERSRYEARLGDGDGRIQIRAGDARVRVRGR
jgi:DUF4097 and DUF4098 domain-containing protein YvlB